MTEVDRLENDMEEEIGSSRISITLPEYYYEKMREVSVKYGGIQGFIIYALRRYVAKHKNKIKNPRRRRYTVKLDDTLKKEIQDLAPEFFLNLSQSFTVCILDLLKEEGVE